MIVELLSSLTSQGVTLATFGDSLKVSAPLGSLTDSDIAAMREHKLGILRLLRLAEGLPSDDVAEQLMAMQEVDPRDVPVCPTCDELFDTQVDDQSWICSRCDPTATDRRNRTKELLDHGERIRREILEVRGPQPNK